MTHRFTTALALSACLFAPVVTFAAAPAENTVTVAPQPNTKQVHMMLKNRGTSTLHLTIQGQTVTLPAAGTATVNAPVGTQVIDADSNSVRLTVMADYNNATASLQ